MRHERLVRNVMGAVLAGSVVFAPVRDAHADAVVTFEAGPEGWIGPTGGGGATVIEPVGGNPGANMHTTFNNFGITFSTNSNTDFVTDYTQFDTVTISVDMRVHDISFFGSPVTRPWVLELRDYDNVPAGYPWVSVWYEFAWVGAFPPYVTWSVTISDTSAAALPPGWGGYGDENQFAEPILPANRTFTDVLAGIDEVAFTTLEPGWFFGFTDFDVRLDNIAITTTGGVPCPGDLDGSGDVGFADILAIIGAWGPCAGACPEDLSGNGQVDFADILAAIGNWGPCP